MKINLDPANKPIPPTLVLANKSGDIIGTIKQTGLKQSFSMNNAGELNCVISKNANKNNFTTYNGVQMPIWDQIKDFKLLHDTDHDIWYQISVNSNDSNGITKDVTGTTLCEAELSQIMLYNVEINTEDDIARDDYDVNNPTLLYKADDPDNSLLHRITQKAPHYTIKHVDSTIAGIQRMFSFDDVSICDSFKEISEEINCIFVFNNGSKKDGTPAREISVYDLYSNCMSEDCGYRGDFQGECPECGNTDITEGYGEDTSIFITSDDLSDEINMTTDVDSVKNCFKLEAGDDAMTAEIRLCNPSGSDYLYYFSEDMLSEMSERLVNTINTYNQKCDFYQSAEYIAPLDPDLVDRYNSEIVSVFQDMYNESHKDSFGEQTSELNTLSPNIAGYADLMLAYCDIIDIFYYLKSELMPTVQMSDTTALEQLNNIETQLNNSTVAVETLASTTSTTTINNAVLSIAKAIVDPRYSVKINSGSFSYSTKKWVGGFIVTNYSAADEDTEITSAEITVNVNTDTATFIKQKIEKTLAQRDGDIDYSDIFGIEDDIVFSAELKKYCLDSLTQFYNMCDSCISIIVEQGIPSSDETYKKYNSRIKLIQSELDLRSNQISIIFDGDDLSDYSLVDNSGLYVDILILKDAIQKDLDLQNNLDCEGVYEEFCMHIREQKYQNQNYVSDGLTNTQMIEYAQDFIKQASEELYKSAELQHSIDSSLRNLLIIPKFECLRDSFECGNWIRAEVDGNIYKLRLLEFTIDYDVLEDIDVTFSDVLRKKNGISDVQSILSSASSMATSYDAVTRQASRGDKSKTSVDNWVENGIDAKTVNIASDSDHQNQIWGDQGILCRRWEDTLNDFAPEQLRIKNSTIQITDDKWNTIKSALGKMVYVDESGEQNTVYGINCEVLIGKMILGETLKLQNDDNSLSFDHNGLSITNGDIIIKESPNSSIPISISKRQSDGASSTIFSVDSSGSAIFAGTINATGGTFSGNIVAKGIISGGTFLGSKIRSENYSYSNGNFSSNGMEIALGGNGYIRAKNFAIDTNGNAYFKGDIKSTATISGGTIQGAKITGEVLEIEAVSSDSGMTFKGGIWTEGKNEDGGILWHENKVTVGVYANNEMVSGIEFYNAEGGYAYVYGPLYFIEDNDAYVDYYKPIHDGNIDYGIVSGELVADEMYSDVTVKFHHEFSGIPSVVVTRYASSSVSDKVANSASRSIVVYGITTESFNVRLYNNTTTSWSASFQWQAIYIGY